MYLYDRRLSGAQVRPPGNPRILRPSQRYFYARRDPMMNRVGEFTSLREVPANQISSGEFGRTLSNGITIPAPVVALLRLSNKFTTMIGTLDQSYVSIWVPDASKHRLPSTVPLSAAGVITGGAFVGLRIIEAKESNAGSMFDPFDRQQIMRHYDLILIEKPAPSDTMEWIEVIAHETGHAFNLVTGASPATGTMADRIRAAITDEIITRGIEATVVSEILQTTAGGQQLRGQQPSNKGTISAIVERDFFPGPLRRTYLEFFVLRELIREAIDKQQLSDAQIQEKDRQVQSLPLQGWRSRTFPSDDYSRLRFWLRVIDFRWQQLRKMHPSQSPAFAWGREIVLQEHANAFFGGVTGGKIGYTALPAAMQPRPPVRRAVLAPAPKRP